MKVLVVDDNAPLAENLAEMLADEGHDVRFETSPEEALALPECFDAYVLDVRMPGIDGWQLKARLLARCPAAKVVLVSGFADRELRPETELVVPLPKPVPFELLLARLTAA